MIGESDFVSLACCVDNEVVVQIEKKAARILVVDLPATIRLILRNYLAAIFADKFILLSAVFKEDSPSGDVTRCHQEMLSQATLNAHVLARHLCQVELMRAALTQVGIAFTDRQVATALLGVALSLAFAPRESIGTI